MIIYSIADLLACPFCASHLLRVVKLPLIEKDFQNFTIHDSHIECLNCGADGPKMAFVTDVKKAWNERKS